MIVPGDSHAVDAAVGGVHKKIGHVRLLLDDGQAVFFLRRQGGNRDIQPILAQSVRTGNVQRQFFVPFRLHQQPQGVDRADIPVIQLHGLLRTGGGQKVVIGVLIGVVLQDAYAVRRHAQGQNARDGRAVQPLQPPKQPFQPPRRQHREACVQEVEMPPAIVDQRLAKDHVSHKQGPQQGGAQKQ